MKRLIVVTFIAGSILNCKPSPQEMYVNAKGGLNMRDKPEISGATIVTIPWAHPVQKLAETGSDVTISGSTGKWTKVKYEEKSGWVFGGFLEDRKNRRFLPQINNKTLVLLENAQDGPPFFIQLAEDNSFRAVCQVSNLVRGAERGALLEKYSGKWNYVVKSGQHMLRLSGIYSSVMFSQPVKKHEGTMKEASLEIELRNDKLFFKMKNSQIHDSCFSVETYENNYGWKIQDINYFSKLMKDIHFPL